MSLGAQQQPVSIQRLPAVMSRTGLSRSQIYALISKGLFPEQIKLGGSRASGWVTDEVTQWIQERITSRQTRNSA